MNPFCWSRELWKPLPGVPCCQFAVWLQPWSFYRMKLERGCWFGVHWAVVADCFCSIAGFVSCVCYARDLGEIGKVEGLALIVMWRLWVLVSVNMENGTLDSGLPRGCSLLSFLLIERGQRVAKFLSCSLWTVLLIEMGLVAFDGVFWLVSLQLLATLVVFVGC